MNTTSIIGSLPSTDEPPPLMAEGRTEEAHLAERTNATPGENASLDPRILDPPGTPKQMAQNALVLGGC